MNYFVTGTDTGVGKTFVTALMTRSLRAAGMDTVALKPISCGDMEDVRLLRAAADNTLNEDSICPCALPLPAAPYTNMLVGGNTVDLELIKKTFQHLRAQYRSILVEGVGGWLVPIQRNYFVRDLARELGLPVVVVVANRLGAINHTLLTIESIRASGLICGGIVLNQTTLIPDAVAHSNRTVLTELLDVPILLEVEYGKTELGMAVV
ncbi:MAG: dethiobiotin synthase [Chthoniobacterales bacterium]